MVLAGFLTPSTLESHKAAGSVCDSIGQQSKSTSQHPFELGVEGLRIAKVIFSRRVGRFRSRVTKGLGVSEAVTPSFAFD